jgi:hypothetical protein
MMMFKGTRIWNPFIISGIYIACRGFAGCRTQDIMQGYLTALQYSIQYIWIFELHD